MTKDKAIALCRMSTSRQRIEGHSLEHQEESVNKAADYLGVKIVKRWSLDTSSKAGKNFKRKDLKEIIVFCRYNSNIKILLARQSKSSNA